MAVDLLDAPLRISWDLYAEQNPLSADQVEAVADQLLDAGIFYVTLEADPLAHPSILPLLEKLTSGGCQVALVMQADAPELALLASVPQSVRLFLVCAPAVESGALDADLLGQRLSAVRGAGRDPSLLWVPQSGQLPILLDLLRFCAAAEVPCFKLPNQKISATSDPGRLSKLPNCSDLEQLTSLVRSSGLPDVAAVRLEVHDLFLWELLQPLCQGERTEYGGCQAGNSLGHIDSAGQLHPCSSWPEPLGSLLTEDLYDLWQSATRLEIRRQITETPIGCEGCNDYSICFGGCRGLSGFCRDDGLKRDLLCAARR